MGRWEPDAMGRLRTAALDLFDERGYDGTTVADIAERAGLTARTFFRYFADKREVLFAGSQELQQSMAQALRDPPEPDAPIDAVGRALDRAAEMLGRDRRFARRRQAIITANAELRERELIKFASLADGLAAALRDRGVGEPQASLAAEAGVAVLRVSFERWVHASDEADLTTTMRASMRELRALATAEPDS